jgi:hypothetical protein
MEAKPIFHLSLTFHACMARVTLNGLHIAAVDARAAINLAPPINVFLVGKGNALSIEAVPVITRTGMSSPMDIDVTGSISAFQAGDIVAPEGGGEVVLEVNLRRSLAGQAPSIPIQVAYAFDNEGPAFPEVFREAEVIDDPAPLLDYAMRLRDLFAAGDVAGLVNEFAPKLRDYAAAYYKTEAALRDEFVGFVQGTLLPGPMDLTFKKADVVPISMCEGRIWEIARRGAVSNPGVRGARGRGAQGRALTPMSAPISRW